MTTLARIEAYYDEVPRAAAAVEEIGPFTLFIGRGQDYYARPRLGATGPWSIDDVERVRARQAELGVPQELEWVHDIHPELAAVVEASGLRVEHVPLMVLRSEERVGEPPAGYRVRVLVPDDPAIAATRAAIGLGFGAPGMAVGVAGAVERDAAAAVAGEVTATLRERLEKGLVVMAAAEDESGPVAGGSHSPRGGVTEITGVATLPAARRRGLGAAVTAELLADARRRGVETCFLSAESDDVARMYARLGFVRIATACLAAPGAD